MICFTVFNDKDAYRGFTLGTNNSIGLNFDLCNLIEAGHQPKPPVITSLENRRYLKVSETVFKAKGLVLRASLTTTITDPEIVLINDDNSEYNKSTALVHWIVTNQSHLGHISLSESLKGASVYRYKYTQGYLEVLFSLSSHLTSTDMYFEKNQKISATFKGGRLKIISNPFFPNPITLCDD